MRDERYVHPDITKWQQRSSGVSSSGDVRRSSRQAQRFRDEPIVDPDDQINYPLGLELPPGFQKDAGTLTYAPVSSRGFCRYLGRAVPRLASIDLGWRVTTAGGVPTYAELAIAISEEPEIFPTDQTFQVIQYVDIATAVQSAARKITTFADFEQVNYGSHLWAWMVIQAGTPPVLRGGTPAECGVLMEKSGSARPSTNSGVNGWAEAGTATNDVWYVIKQRQA